MARGEPRPVSPDPVRSRLPPNATPAPENLLARRLTSLRSPNIWRRITVTILAVFLSVPAALAQDAQKPATKTITLSATQAAQLLIASNRLDEAKKLLERELAASPDDSENLFLLATIAAAQKDYDTAISLYRRILVREPDAERVRLELARAFFLKGDYDNADRQFRFARAGDIDDAVKANIDHFLAAINRLREWTVNFSLALAPDTNQNAATSASPGQYLRPALRAGQERAQAERHRRGRRYRRGMVTASVRQSKGADRRRPDPHGLQRRPVRRHDPVRLCRAAVSVPGLGHQPARHRLSALVCQPGLSHRLWRQDRGRLRHHLGLVDQRILWRPGGDRRFHSRPERPALFDPA